MPASRPLFFHYQLGVSTVLSTDLALSINGQDFLTVESVSSHSKVHIPTDQIPRQLIPLNQYANFTDIVEAIEIIAEPAQPLPGSSKNNKQQRLDKKINSLSLRALAEAVRDLNVKPKNKNGSTLTRPKTILLEAARKLLTTVTYLDKEQTCHAVASALNEAIAHDKNKWPNIFKCL